MALVIRNGFTFITCMVGVAQPSYEENNFISCLFGLNTPTPALAPSMPKWPKMGILGTIFQKSDNTIVFSVKFYPRINPKNKT